MYIEEFLIIIKTQQKLEYQVKQIQHVLVTGTDSFGTVLPYSVFSPYIIDTNKQYHSHLPKNIN